MRPNPPCPIGEPKVHSFLYKSFKTTPGLNFSANT